MVRKGRKGSSRDKRSEIAGVPGVHPGVMHLCAVAIILFFGLFCYADTFSVPFVLDDVTSILTNPLVQQFDFRLKSRILGDLSFALNYRLNGLDVAGYHLVNLAFHLLNACLVYLLVQLIFRTPLLAGSGETGVASKSYIPRSIGFAAALLFVSHPLQTQAVTYIAQRVTVMAATFYLGALVCYGASRLSRSRVVTAVLLVSSLLLAGTGVLAKENVVTIPFTVLMFELTFFRGHLKDRLLPVVWYLVPLLLGPLLIIGRVGFSPDFLAVLGQMTAEGGAPQRLTYLLTQFPVMVSYLRLFFLPVGQNLDHDVPLRTTLADPVVLGSLLVLVLVAAIGVRLWLRARRSGGGEAGWRALAGFGIGWFFITLAVESSVIPIRDVMFEHRLYLPSVGLVLMVSGAGWRLATRWQDGKGALLLFLAAVTLLGMFSSVATFLRNRVWQDEITLWQDVVRKSPVKARGYGSLGHAQQRAGRPQEALQSYRQAVQLAPADYIARNNLGTIYLALKRPEDALDQFKEALRAAPSVASVHYNLGLAYGGLGYYDRAVAAYREAIRVGGENDQTLNNLGIALFRLGKTGEALESFKEAVRRNPGNISAAGNLANLEKAQLAPKAR